MGILEASFSDLDSFLTCPLTRFGINEILSFSWKNMTGYICGKSHFIPKFIRKLRVSERAISLDPHRSFRKELLFAFNKIYLQ